jgi:hypothetical protein
MESECLMFEQHVRAASELWTDHESHDTETFTSRPSVIVTTESQEIRREYRSYIAHEDDQPARFRFVTNHLDVTQDTGYFGDDSISRTFSAEKAMLSAMSSLKAQLSTRVTLGNCCSNFHLLLKDLLEEGCGASAENRFQCLQEHDNLEYRVCCAWDKSSECQARLKFIKEQLKT